YGHFFRFPEIYYEVAWSSVGQAAVISLLVGLSGGLAAITRAMKLPPAVAMRPEAPLDYRPSGAERIGLSMFLSPLAMMVLRRLERRWNSTLLSVMGMALGVALVVLGSFMEDTLDYIIDVQFQQAQQQDVTVTFNEVLSAAAINDAAHLPGVLQVEGFRAVPVRLENDQYSYRTSLMGLESQPELFRVLDEDAQPVPIVPGGLTISEKMAELLHLQIGDEVIVQVQEGRRQQYLARIASVFPDYADPAVYAERKDLHRFLEEGECYSGVFLLVDPNYLDSLNAQLKVTPASAGVTLKMSALQSFHDTIAENLRPMRIINAAFASTIAFGVIYSCALSALAERRRDLATLRVLGYTRREVSKVLTGELAVITLLALPIGLPIGYLLAWVASVALDTETQRIPLVMSNATFAYGAVIVLIAASISALIVRGMIDQLDLIAVLKVRE
ncbi:MAG: ABC transporter permease, partial [Planctomycetaceae bacterium]|nr:ABC transporter permease [Planctomycetaceae bacterium]